MKKARTWLEQNNIEFTFHNYRKDGLDRSWLEARIADLGWEQVVNRRGTTWRKLPEDIRASMDANRAVDALLENTGMIKRPLLGPLPDSQSGNDEYLLGFSADKWQEKLGL